MDTTADRRIDTGTDELLCAVRDRVEIVTLTAKRDWAVEQRVADPQDWQRRLTGALAGLRRRTGFNAVCRRASKVPLCRQQRQQP